MDVLAGLLHKHETLQKSCSSQHVNQKSSSSHHGKPVKRTLGAVGLRPYPSSQCHNLIYVNPNKIGPNAVKSKEITSNDVSTTAIKTQITIPRDTYDPKLVKRSSVFINPNFNKSASYHQGGTSLSVPNVTRYETSQNIISSHSEFKSNKSLIRVPEKCKNSNLSSPNTKIFVNPQFNLPENTLKSKYKREFNLPENTLKSKYKRVIEPSVVEKHIHATSSARMASNKIFAFHNLTSKQNNPQLTNLKSASNQSNLNSSKRKIDQSNQALERSVVQYKRAKSKVTNLEEFGKKIFVNPSFKNELNNTKVSSDQNDKMGAAKLAAASQPSSSSNPGQSCNEVGPLINLNDQRRRRSSSSSLVSVSATKLIRKRKLSQGSSRKKFFKTTPPVFLSKTKLVRNTATPCFKNIPLLSKTIVKRAVPKTQLQYFNADKVKRLRRQSFTNSITNLVNIVPTSTVVTKVKSTNGRSLKLLRKPLDSSVILRVKSGNGKSLKLIRNPEDLTTVTKIKSNNGKTLKFIRKAKDLNKLLHDKSYITNVVQRQRQLHLQQASKRAQHFLQSKWSQNKFFKTNMPSTGKPLRNRNKYVFERNRSLTKNMLSKLKVESRQILPNNINNKFVTSNGNVAGSKYKLIRRPTCDLGNTSKHVKKRSSDLGIKSCPSTSNKKWKKQKKVSKPPQRKQLSIVNIGGVFYRCTRTSLCRNKTSSKKDKDVKGPLLKIRGQKFQFDDNGHTLKCLDNKPGRKRIDIGGVTFISSSSGNSLTRTNYHTARSILTQAKQKSLSLHVNKLRKNNEPCPFFHRFGRCTGKERGTCIRQHDPKFVGVCKKFVSGTCTDAQCLLSHVTSMHNMPTCQHYLAGQCARDPCPYLHVKLSDSAPLCIDFLKGYCSRGDQLVLRRCSQYESSLCEFRRRPVTTRFGTVHYMFRRKACSCTKRHLELCPSFEKGACPRGKYCPYPHPKSTKKQKVNVKTVKRKPPPPPMEQKAVSINVRYFDDIKLQEENKIHLVEKTEDLCSASDEKTSEGEDNIVHRLKNRPKLGRLPSYIPLSMDSSP